MSTKLYLAGPMSNIPGYNFPAFEAATTELRAQGFDIISPAEQDKARDPEAYERAKRSPDGKWDPSETGGLTWAQILAADIIIVSVLLPGWEKSSGARLEAFVGLLRKKRFGLYRSGDEPFWVPVDYIRESLRRNMP